MITTTKQLYGFFQSHPSILVSTLLKEAGLPRAIIMRMELNKDNDLPIFVYGSDEEKAENLKKLNEACKKYGAKF